MCRTGKPCGSPEREAERARKEEARAAGKTEGQRRRPLKGSVDMLGLPAEEAPFYDKSSAALSRKLLEEMLGDGNFGHHKSLPDFSHLWKPLRKLGNLGIHHVLSARRLKYSPRHTLMYYRKMWKDGLANAFR